MNTKSLIRGAAWTTWVGSVIFTKGATAPVAPFVEALADRADDLLSSIIANWVSEDLRSENLDPGSLDANGHLENLVVLAIQGVVHNLPKHDPRAKSHGKTCKDLGKALGKTWPTLNLLNRPVPDSHPSPTGESSSWVSETLADLGVERLHRIVVAHVTAPAETTVFSVEVWENIIRTAWAGTKPLDPDLLKACAEALHRHLGHYFYETTKAAAGRFPEAYAGVQLSILGEQTELLRDLHQFSNGLALWLGGRFDEIARAFAQQTMSFSEMVADRTESVEVRSRLAQIIDEFHPDLRKALVEIREDTTAIKDDTSAILAFLRDQSLTVAAGVVIQSPRHLPQPAKALFGRQEDLDRLLPLFRSHRRLALTGPGGLGKTSLAAALIERFEREEGTAATVGGIFSHDFYRHPGLGDFVEGILRQAGIASEDPARQPALAAYALRQPGVLLYLEGAEKLDVIAELLEFLDDSTRLLVTTRDPRQAEGMEAYPVEPISEEEAARAIHWHAAHRPRSQRAGPWPHGKDLPGWRDLARDLGGHPLACVIAGDHCGRFTLAPHALYDQLRERGLQILNSGDDSKHNLDVLFRQSAEAIRGLSPGDPSPALMAWLLLCLGGTNPTPTSILEAFGLVSVEESMRPLLDLELAWSIEVAAERDGVMEIGYALSHALLGEWGRRGLAEFGCGVEVLLVSAMRWGLAFFDAVEISARVPGGWDRYIVILPLAESLLKEVESINGIPTDILELFYYLPGLMGLHHARYLSAEPHYRRCVDAVERLDGQDSASLARALSNLATLLQTTNRLAEAEPLMMRALTITEVCYGKNHPIVAICLNNLATMLQATNRLAEAESLLRRSLAIAEANYGASHAEVAVPLSNLAQLLQSGNRTDEAETLMRRALAIDGETHGANHPNVAIRLGNLATLLQATNRLPEAERLMRWALAIAEANFGPDHPAVAINLSNLGSLLQETNRLTEAEALARRALAIHEATEGVDHPNVARSLGNLGGLLQATNRLTEAEPLFRRALAISESSYGSNHPEVARDLANLAGILGKTSRHVAAEPLIKRSLSIIEASYGGSHPEVANCLSNLASLLLATNRESEAEPMFTRALAIDEGSFGINHPRVARSLGNLASILYSMRRMAEAEPLLRRALSIDEATYGANHPDVARDLNNLASLLQATNRPEEAELLMRRQLGIILDFTRATGHQHPHLDSAIANYVQLLVSIGRSEAEIQAILLELEPEFVPDSLD